MFGNRRGWTAERGARRSTLGLAIAAIFVAACGEEDPRGAAAAERGAGRTGASASGVAENGGPDGAGSAARGPGGPAGRGGPGGRPAPARTLAASDVASGGRSVIEESVPINGDLNLERDEECPHEQDTDGRRRVVDAERAMRRKKKARTGSAG